MAGIEPGDDVCEPEAGTGDIADAIREACPDNKLSVIEIWPSLREILELKGHNLVDRDFLQHDQLYDRIIMNPPFENGQDIDHLQHAYNLLKPGGRVVSIMCEGVFFREDKKSSSFRQWLEECGGYSEELPEDTFKNAKSLRQTGVRARVVVIDKQ
jgi:16S rRNA G1207 methylase RsmC